MFSTQTDRPRPPTHTHTLSDPWAWWWGGGVVSTNPKPFTWVLIVCAVPLQRRSGLDATAILQRAPSPSSEKHAFPGVFVFPLINHWVTASTDCVNMSASKQNKTNWSLLGNQSAVKQFERSMPPGLRVDFVLDLVCLGYTQWPQCPLNYTRRFFPLQVLLSGNLRTPTAGLPWYKLPVRSKGWQRGRSCWGADFPGQFQTSFHRGSRHTVPHSVWNITVTRRTLTPVIVLLTHWAVRMRFSLRVWNSFSTAGVQEALVPRSRRLEHLCLSRRHRSPQFQNEPQAAAFF